MISLAARLTIFGVVFVERGAPTASEWEPTSPPQATVLVVALPLCDLRTTIRQNLVFLARNSAVRVRNPKDGLHLSPAGGGGRRKATGGGLFGFDFGCG